MKSGVFIILFFFSFSLSAQSRCQVIQCCRGAQKECLVVECPAGIPYGECCYLFDNRWHFGFAPGNCSL